MEVVSVAEVPFQTCLCAFSVSIPSHNIYRWTVCYMEVVSVAEVPSQTCLCAFSVSIPSHNIYR